MIALQFTITNLQYTVLLIIINEICIVNQRHLILQLNVLNSQLHYNFTFYFPPPVQLDAAPPYNLSPYITLPQVEVL